jgi:hypothetical protein
MTDKCRQHYELATGKSLQKSPGGPTPGYKAGGKVAMKKPPPVAGARFKKGGAARGR